jgi:hypothetical protein
VDSPPELAGRFQDRESPKELPANSLELLSVFEAQAVIILIYRICFREE